MKLSTLRFRPLANPINTARKACLLAALLCGAGLAQAYPPAPHHQIYGTVRDEMGNPLVVTNAEVVFSGLNGVQLKTPIVSGLMPGVNYRLSVPMDAGLTADAYKPTALRPALPFLMKVTMGGRVYLPLEMAGNYQNLGAPAESTRIDLTLGEDSDSDGLPDAWERSLLSGNLTLADIRPDGDSDSDGLSNLEEYLAGTYAFDASDGLRLGIHRAAGRLFVDFVAITGRTYTLHASSNLQEWSAIPFRIPAEGANATSRTLYQAREVQPLRLEILAGDAEPPCLFLRAQVQ